MSFDDYVNHITHKYRLATAIAVINTKPEDVTLEEYIITLKNKLSISNMDADFNDSVSSGDFEIDYSNPVLDGSPDPTDACDPVSDVTATNNDEIIPDNNTDAINANPLPFPENLSQITFYEEAENKLSNNINIPLHHNDSQETYFEESQEILINDTGKKGSVYKSDGATKSIVVDKTKEHVNFNKSNYINVNDLEETEIYTVPEFIDNCTHYSESQFENIKSVGNKYILDNNKINTADKENFLNKYSQNAQNIDLYIDQTQNMDFIFEDNLNVLSQERIAICESIDKNHNQDIGDERNGTNNFTSDVEKQQDSIRNDTNEVDMHVDVLNEEEEGENEKASNVVPEELEEMNEEVVPFKIIEELNKVKIFLKKRNEKRSDGCVTDSGYRSDSQGKSFRSGSQLSVNSVNQSAHCLLDYIKTCPLLSTTREIVKEISEVLGSLVDRLHEDEIYPPFIDAVLETIDLSLRQMTEGDGGCDDALSTKDNIFQRILHLNKSKNIQKYTINNITKYIEVFSNESHDRESHRDMNKICRIENLCYILYTLEVILTDYTKVRCLPTTQTSQDDGRLKRSSLSDVWRRKWNPDSGVTKREEGGIKGKCVLEYCSDALNKLTVNCMESYSLISYLALKCYNVLQTL